ncbi:Rint-1 family protein [Phytophthora cinnamomi]|uniref:Rint-1 family protein n=1 Tax=Phytophthora cinnamomi TaxID=4785 RepID=UPI0035594CF6|nr:Rint-1 family protein [Phytophthora cinnamomi]
MPSSPSPLAALSTTLLASVPADASEQELRDVDWSLVSAALAALRLRTQEELTELATALDPADATAREDTVEEHNELLALHTDIKSIQPQLTVAEQHFVQLESIVRPGLAKLQTLQSRAEYLEAAVQVEQLSQEAKIRAVQTTPDALEAFRTFAAFATAIPEQFSVVRREAARRVEDLSVDLRHFAVEKLQLALEKINWPEPMTTQQEIAGKEAELQDVSQAFGYLLTLQLSQQSQPASASTDLWAMECVLDPLLLRFRYHFERLESATNRLAKPEWYLSHVQEQTNAHTRFLAHALTPELHRHREEVHCWDAQILLLRGLVKAACRKLTQDLPILLAHPPLLCHTLDEVLLFEQTIDDDVGYGSWASADRRAYPRCVDVFTSRNDVLFAWTCADVEYAHRMLSSSLEREFSGECFDFSASREKRESIWQLEDEIYRCHEGSAPGRDQDLVPPAAVQFVSLLDFLSQRFTLMETEEHRYLYVVQVHLPLLRRFGQLCDARGRRLINALAKKTSGGNTQNAWDELFVVVNALQYVAHSLAAWEQSSVFLELSRKIARSETTRAQVLRMHVAYSRQVLARASAAVLATEEATAVRQALAGPGAMIGPTAAFSAAYSVGSKTMKSLFRRAETDGKMDEQGVRLPSMDTAPPAAAPNGNGNDSTSINNHPLGDPEQDDPETLVFSHTIFERQISELKSLATALLEGVNGAVVRAAERDVGAYRLSPFWTDTKHVGDDADNSVRTWCFWLSVGLLWESL